MDVGSEVPERWNTPRLAELVNGTTVTWWKTAGIPRLVRRGVLVKVGRGWFGVRSQIVRDLMGGE
jgi:hypothetical protein